MIKCRLSLLMGERKIRVADVSRDTGLPRSTVTALYKETAERVELSTIDTLCEYFGCEVGDLLRREPDQGRQNE